MSAVVEFRNTTWVDDTAQLVFTGAGHVTAIEIQPHQQQVNTVFVQVFDSVTTAIGVQTPLAVLPVVQVSVAGAGTSPTDATVTGGQKRVKYVFPGRGIQCTTGIMIAVSTTAAAFTAATTTSLPPNVRVFFAPDHE